MSCGNPETEPEGLMPRRLKYDKSKTCVKCKETTGNIVIRHAVYCKACFFSLITFRFRRSLEPLVNPKPDGPRRTALKPSGDLLIGFSGGLGSTVLLDLVHRCYVNPDKSQMATEGGRDHPRKDRVWKKITVCYVEVCDAFPGMKDRTEEIRKVVDGYEELELVLLRIQDAFDPAWWKSVGISPDLSHLGVNMTDGELHLTSIPNLHAPISPLSALQSYLAALPTPSALPTTLNTLTRLLLLHTAFATGCSHLLLGTSLTSMAVSLISGVAQGAGFHVREIMQEEWVPVSWNSSDNGPHEGKRKTSGSSVRVIRPLRDIGMKECGGWAWWMGLRVIGREKWEWPGSKQGIGRLTKEFIVGLEKDYPSTVSTIVRTCGKLAPKGEVSGRCISCERPVQQGVEDWKARISIRSRASDDGDPSMEELPLPTLASLTPYLCYPCYTTFTSRSSRPGPALYPGRTDVSSTMTLPVWTRSRLQEMGIAVGERGDDGEVTMKKHMGREEMKKVVKEFLLED